MDSKSVLSIFFMFILFYSWVALGFSENVGGLPEAAGGSGDGNASPHQSKCVQKLMACQPYLHNSSSPPATCCLPLKEMITKEVGCLCGVITNPGILKSFNITANDAIKLAKACGANADLSICKNATAPSPTGPSVPSPTPPPPNNASTNGSSAKTNAGHRMPSLERSSFIIAFFVGFIFLALLSAQ